MIIVDCNEGILPMKNSDIEEERRLMYVAITRAKDFLMISNIDSYRDNLKQKRLLNSLFIIDLKKAI